MIAPLPKPLVLIVEDQPEVCQLLADVLGRAGYETETSPDGNQVAALVRRRWPAAVLLDLSLPRRSGLCVLAELRAIDPDLPVIILTGHGSPDLVRAAMSGGAFDFFTKPFDNAVLVAALSDALAAGHHFRQPVEVSRA